MFNGDLNFLMLKETEVVENVQVWRSRVIETQMVAVLVQYANHLLDKVQGVWTKQLEMGEVVMKGVTMKVLARHSCASATVRSWTLFERIVIKEGLTALMKSVMTNSD